MPKADSHLALVNLSVITITPPTVLGGTARHGNIYAGSYHNRKRENVSGYKGSNPHRITKDLRNILEYPSALIHMTFIYSFLLSAAPNPIQDIHVLMLKHHFEYIGNQRDHDVNYWMCDVNLSPYLLAI